MKGRPRKNYNLYTGKKFGRITVDGLSHKNQYGIYFADVTCECGNQKKVSYSSLDAGRTRSCGCLHDEGNRKTHGKKSHPLYGVWSAIKDRCRNESNKCYAIYGGKGVTLCDEWERFEPFYEWAISSGYMQGLSIDRINSDGNYEPDNCRWANAGTQSRNTSRNIYIQIDGEAKTISEWARAKGIPPKRISDRINKLGWNPVDAVCK